MIMFLSVYGTYDIALKAFWRLFQMFQKNFRKGKR
jgi:hypothetical protein